MVDKQDTNSRETIDSKAVEAGQSLDDIIRNAVFPDDYDAFEDSMLDMIP